MNFDNSNIRRQDRLLSAEQAKALLAKGEYAFLSMSSANGGYGVPISYVWNGENAIYCHCAPEGEKLRAIVHDSRVTLCVVGDTQVQSRTFTTAYESVLVHGCIEVVTDDTEAMNALHLFLTKYTPDNVAIGMKYAEKSFQRTRVLKLNISSVSGKAKVVK